MLGTGEAGAQPYGGQVMAGVLLNSGSLQQYTAIGDEGQPVYSVATQLREAVRLKVGLAAANCLAVPRVNESRSVIDWYSPIQGMVVPWSAATDQERSEALRDLDQFQQEMVHAVAKLDGVSDREKRTVQNLLTKVFHFPGRDCVFLVDGKPILTFWGFQQSNTTPVADPFHALRPTGPATPPPVGAQVAQDAMPARRRPWWLWLLLLLLLALLLFWLLRSCVQNPTVVLPDIVSENAQDQSHDPATLKDEPAQGVQGVAQDVQRWWRRVIGQEPALVDADPGSTEQAVDGAGDEGGAGDVGDLGNLADPGDADNADAVTEGSQAQTEPSADGQDPPASEEGLLPGEDPEAAAAKDNTGKDENGQDQTNPDQTAQDEAAQESVEPPAADPATDPASNLGDPLAIPPDAMKSGSVQFLDGNWRAAGGIQDSQTGKPVRLQYQFEDGRAKVVVDRGNGVQCEGAAQSSIIDGRLQISEQGTVAKCSDGSSFAIPRISCTPDQSGRSQCTGQTPDGRSLPITIRQMP